MWVLWWTINMLLFIGSHSVISGLGPAACQFPGKGVAWRTHTGSFRSLWMWDFKRFWRIQIPSETSRNNNFHTSVTRSSTRDAILESWIRCSLGFAIRRLYLQKLKPLGNHWETGSSADSTSLYTMLLFDEFHLFTRTNCKMKSAKHTVCFFHSSILQSISTHMDKHRGRHAIDNEVAWDGVFHDPCVLQGLPCGCPVCRGIELS